VWFVARAVNLEIAVARDGTDAGLRRAWRERQKGRATLLLTVHDAGLPGAVRVLGPTDERVMADADGLILQVLPVADSDAGCRAAR
jgi:hypothetical protein